MTKPKEGSFKLNRIYTRSGDGGETSLVGGERVSKTNPRIVACGDVDELNCVLGCVKEELKGKDLDLKQLVEDIQQDLFDLGAEIASPSSATAAEKFKLLPAARIKAIEELCRSYNRTLTELDSFILPGGSRLAAQLHFSRAVARRAERAIAVFSTDEMRPEVLIYLNRLSDLLFILSRWVLSENKSPPPMWRKPD